jgi:hypothetical protein
MEKLNCEIAIIGGGPSGSTSATLLSRMGHDVMVFEREKFPRPHVGESLVPFCYPLFENLGVIDQMKNGFVRKPGVRFINKDDSYRTTYCFKNILPGPEKLSFHVLRARFDDLLLQNSRKNGAKVFEQHGVKNVDLTNPDKAVLQIENEKGEQIECTARFLIDCSGQDTFLGKKHRNKKKHEDLDRIAFLTHWKGADMSDGLNDGLLHIIYLADDKRGWLGIQAVDVDRLSVGLIVDNTLSREAKEKFVKEGNGDWKLAFYKHEVLRGPYTREILKNAEIIQELMVVSNYSYSITKKFDTNYVVLGDSASFLDPIFATGVYIAMKSVFITVPAISSLVKGENEKGMNELAKAILYYEGAINFVDRFLRLFYNFSKVNLAEVSKHLSDNKVREDKEIIFSLLHFLMGGDFFENYEKYEEYLTFIEQPKQLARYQHYVMNREVYKETNCPMPYEVIFPMAQK